jgi:hypothetical protein
MVKSMEILMRKLLSPDSTIASVARLKQLGEDPPRHDGLACDGRQLDRVAIRPPI